MGFKELEGDGDGALDLCNVGHHIRHGAIYLHIMPVRECFSCLIAEYCSFCNVD